ncbi:tetratricopeptide repeat protein [Leucothrix pacifica]|uniref:Uncharacterized protein n=1 Tax=Leucothrix pacifica TaxID=1247513 RepID=A0A317CN72_9GAMM|nr:tetratricopeptide repeat protein [Leucothrix pacifica]PWQ99974.1 hypothetical protein DKW60_03995 [Leucothrix pacifica]
MEMIRWLLGNRIVQAAWGLGILAVLLAWIFGGNKAGHDTAEADSQAKVEQVAESTTATAETAASDAVAEVKQEAVEAVVDTKAAAAAGTAAVAVAAVATTEAVADATEATTEVVTSTAEAVATEVETVQAAVSTEVEEAATEVEAESTEVAAEASEETAVSALTGGFADKSSEDLLMMAREAYWNNGLEEAAEIYTALIEREPSVIEHKGELGNVFWRQGFPKKAAELYADIAEPMIEKGNGERVSNMVGFIGLFFPERAASIRAMLDK